MMKLDACEVREGYVAIGNDCDDAPDVFPRHLNECDEVDNDCNELIDDNVGSIYYLDQDMDGFGQDAETFLFVRMRGFPVSQEIVTTSTSWSIQGHQSCVMKSIMIAMKWLMMVVFISSTQT